MRIIVDIDNTLLDSGQFKKALAQCARDLGVHPRIFWKAYRHLRRDGAFSPEKFVPYLPANFKKKSSLLRERYHRVVRDVEQYFYKDTGRLFRWAKKAGYRISLYTYGEPSVQREKIAALKKRYSIHSTIVTTDRTKRNDFHRCFVKGEMWVWVDDFHEVPVNSSTFRNGTLLYLRRRSKMQPRHLGLPTLQNLSQAILWIDRHIRENP